jgi:hypothetical protein
VGAIETPRFIALTLHFRKRLILAITNGYCTLAQLKASLAITDTTDDTQLEAAISAVSRNIDDLTGRFFYSDGTTTTAAVRYYTPNAPKQLFTDDIVSVSEVAEDTSETRTYSTVWASGDYAYEPINNPRLAKPYTQLIAFGNYTFPVGQTQAIRVSGIFGWSAVPEVVRQACLIQSSRVFNRNASPFGIAGSPDLGTVRLSARLDPDVQVLLNGLIRQNSLVL